MCIDMEPTLVTPAELASVREELIQREPIFHRPELGTTRADFERMTADDFWEIGASGRRYSRTFILDELQKRYADPQEEHLVASGFYCRQLAADTYLLTYNLLQPPDRTTRRTTIWQRTSEGWKIVFHQGTLVQAGQL
jgi:hypothetical protein